MAEDEQQPPHVLQPADEPETPPAVTYDSDTLTMQRVLARLEALT
jgi:hypothetical protein